ncbi:O-antigen polymerase [Altererythrobacter confluentis]|uniref:O-antigen polymerase n=2 Tax=Allopontixanthobacter confluentis TaxID=1849021 RepID=A0A6L7GGV8_9SPHN|nr:O-antigen polymerase [Allopontixanthobacter confluentis]
MSPKLAGNMPLSGRFWLVVCYLTIVFLLGGSARDDIATLVILRPLAIAAIAYALVVITTDNIRQFPVQLGLFLVLILLVTLHLLPLPPSVWQSLPHRELIFQIDVAAGIDPQWRPLSIAPERTWNAFYALLVPLSVMLLVCSLKREERFIMLPVIICLGALSGILGLAQIGGGPQSPLYYYRISNTDSAIGFLANRNHQGVFLATLFPMLAVYASLEDRGGTSRKLRTIASLAMAVILIPLILVTGSRAGLVFGAIGLLSIPFLYRAPRSETVKRRSADNRVSLILIVAAAASALLLVLAGLIFSRAEALERLLGGVDADFRWEIWQPSMQIAMQYFPTGSGIGTFVEAFQRDEPVATLAPTYVNHAHNDWLELLLTGGIPSVILAAIAAWVWLHTSVRVWVSKIDSREISYARMASVILVILAGSSFVDYPLRTPLLGCVLAIVTLWMRPASLFRTTRQSFAKSGNTVSKS